jgi:acyl dehydratase
MSIVALKSQVGLPLPPGEWVTVTQEMINRFADLTGDHQWIHLDEERCRRQSPYGATIAHGMLIQSIIPLLIGGTPDWMQGFSAGVNYGSDKVRFSAPVRAGSRIRGHSMIKEVKDMPNGSVRIVNAFTIEIEGETKPACYAELVGVLYP